jgi:hypothetical protein
MNQAPRYQITNGGWRLLYLAGAAAAVIAVLFFRRNCGAELTAFSGFGIWDVPVPPPVSASEWFALFQSDPFVGLVLFGLIDLVNYGLVGLIFLALYGALREVNRSAMVIATALGLVGVAVYFAANQAFAMLNLSRRYVDATTEAQRTLFLAAGEALLANHNPGSLYQGTGMTVSLLLVLLAGLIISVVLLRSPAFSRWAAYAGILANGFALGQFVALAIAPAILWLPPTISAPFRLAWYILIAIGLFRLARSGQ